MDVMTLGQQGHAPGDGADDGVAGSGRLTTGSDPPTGRERLLARLRTQIILGLEELVDPDAAPADLIALADRHSRRLRAELEQPDGSDLFFGLDCGSDPACIEEREWIRGHLHDTALQILEFIAGDGFGQGLTGDNIAHLAGGAARDLHRWVESVDEANASELLPELELVTAQARTLDPRVQQLSVGEIGTPPPTKEQVEALAGAAREAVTNGRKHANAANVFVWVGCYEDGQTAVTIRDDGIGFDIEQAENGNGLGVKGSIVGRMNRAGGHAFFERAPGGGTLVTLVTPRQGA